MVSGKRGKDKRGTCNVCRVRESIGWLSGEQRDIDLG